MPIFIYIDTELQNDHYERICSYLSKPPPPNPSTTLTLSSSALPSALNENSSFLVIDGYTRGPSKGLKVDKIKWSRESDI